MSFQDKVLVKAECLLRIAEQIGEPDIKVITSAFTACLTAQNDFLTATGKTVKQNSSEWEGLLQPTVEAVQHLAKVTDSLARSPYSEHARTAQEAATALSWVNMPANQVQTFLKESSESATFWGNKVMTKFKGKDTKHVEWVKALGAVLEALAQYTKVDAEPSVCTQDDKQGQNSSVDIIDHKTFRDVIECVQIVVQQSKNIDEQVYVMSDNLLKATLVSQELIDAARSTNHSSIEKDKILQPLTKCIETLLSSCDAAKKNVKVTHHERVIRELVPILSWVLVDSSPALFIKENSEASDFYMNKILKDKEEHSVVWVRALKDFIRTLGLYTKVQHPNGLNWVAHTGITSESSTTRNEEMNTAPRGTSNDRTEKGLFSELQRGTEITSGLRKVSDEEKVYKQKERQTSSVDVQALAQRKKGKGWIPPSGEPNMKLVGNKKWMIEYQCGTLGADLLDLSVGECEKHHAIFISRCQNAHIRIPNKVNTISINECLRVKITLMGTIGPVEITNSQFIDVTYSQNVPSLMIDKCQDTNIYVPMQHIETFEAITSLSANTNIIVPTTPEEIARAEEVQETKSLPVPEQFVSRLSQSNKLTTAPTEHSCG